MKAVLYDDTIGIIKTEYNIYEDKEYKKFTRVNAIFNIEEINELLKRPKDAITYVYGIRTKKTYISGIIFEITDKDKEIIEGLIGNNEYEHTVGIINLYYLEKLIGVDKIIQNMEI